ncbi:MAG TPA: hypothetical protein VFZ28_07430 [Burkholderiaceae bacterium]|nr:hypothetical protein [Burkholderiaceae bacterium]
MKTKPIAMLTFLAAAGSAWASDFAAPGAKATLSVTYRFESAGKKQDKYDLHEWTVKRHAELSAEMVAKKPAALPALQPLDGAQTAKLQQQQAQIGKAHKQMAPMMASAEAVMAKCGDDEKCLEREAMKMGAAMSGTRQLDDTLKVGRETAAVMKPGADRYQAWEGRTQKGSYGIDERWHVVHADPICMSLPKARCTHDMTRKGGGEMAPAAGGALAEVDTQGTLVLQLPLPHGVLDYVETHTTDEPDGAHDVHTPKGPQKGQMPLRVAADGKSVGGRLSVPLKGGWRSQSGEQVVSLGAGGWHGAAGEPGKLVVSWRFVAQ